MGRPRKKNVSRLLNLYLEEYFYPSQYRKKASIYEEEMQQQTLLLREKNKKNEEFLLLRMQAVAVNFVARPKRGSPG